LISPKARTDVVARKRATTSVAIDGLGLLPFFAVLTLFLLIPAVGVFVQALHNSDGTFGFGSMHDAITGQNLDAFVFSFTFSLGAAIVGTVGGFVLTYAITTIDRPRWFRSAVVSFSGVAANMGGVLLAFAFLSLLGRQGLLTRILDSLGWNLYGGDFSLGDVSGLIVVYSYFNIPLMVLVSLAAVENVKSSWREACESLGGGTFTYWRRLGIPILMPTLISGFLLLFVNSFSAYATARALTDNSKIVPLRIGFFLGGDIKTGTDSVGFALAAWMIVVMALAMAAYWILRRRAERWMRA
jgi:putative spermidine/putrescine transport system permease protein